ncbi:hypothetical protein G4B88_001353 [Cannabis sativa]|uniref:Reverse transcriptase n=1 Tax=Cannabis sativa TaxID=3483 RepID=A0A7J6GBM2_CANSA|nr:hypothetical protein G4B88_001353 [Cannabis sativa]
MLKTRAGVPTRKLITNPYYSRVQLKKKNSILEHIYKQIVRLDEYEMRSGSVKCNAALFTCRIEIFFDPFNIHEEGAHQARSKLKGFRCSRSGPRVTHLFFVDDSLMFGRANGGGSRWGSESIISGYA